jgi:hypothetical protein
MNSARRIKLRLQATKPRNPMVAPAARRKAGTHRKSTAAQRQADKRALQKMQNEGRERD